MPSKKNNHPIVPCIDAWVTKSTAQENVGRVTDINPDDNGPRVRVTWLKPRDRKPSWHDPGDLGCGFIAGQEVIHTPPSIQQTKLGRGVVHDFRAIGGREQVLVEFPEAGTLVWLPFQHLAHRQGVHQRFVRGVTGQTYEPERLRLRNLAYLLELWNENTGSLSHFDIDPLPHQIHLVHRILRSGNLNWLVADDVGLGKTIEVGMLLSALQQRGTFRRILVVTPPGVMRQWQEELSDKFGFDDFLIYGHDFEVNEPRHWKLYDHVIGSMDRFKGEDHLSALLGAEPWDLIIVDEAHRLTRRQYGNKYHSSQRFQLAARLRQRSDSIVMLTATPHQGLQDQFKALLELLRPDRRRQIQTLELNPQILEDMVIRNNKADVTDADGNFIFKGKTTKTLSVTVSEASKEFDKALQHYVKKGYQAAQRLGRQGIPIGFVMTVYRKLASSSIAAIHQALRRRRDRLQQESIRQNVSSNAAEIANKDEELQLEDERYVGEYEELVATQNAEQFFEGELAKLDELINQAESLLRDDHKLQSFMERLLEIVDSHREGERILIFTEYRATQSYLEKALMARFGNNAVALIHGGQSQNERREAIERFEESAQFLVSTEAGGEGINLHRRCHFMVNYDLPWNPMRIVQRTGRLYRYGQNERVVVFNVHAPETIDADIVQTMYGKLLQICQDMATVGDEFREGLEDDVLGEVANIMQLDVEKVLANATTEDIDRTQSRIDEALERARAAGQSQQQLFSYVSGYDPNETKGELNITPAHVRAFVEGMFKQVGIEVIQRLHQGMVWELEIPESLHAELPGFKARTQITLDRTWAAGRRDVHMLDMQSPLMRLLIERAKRSDFGGRAAAIRFPGMALLTAVLRWQNNHAVRLRQEFTAIQLFQDGRTATNPEVFSKWLLHGATAGETVLSRETAQQQFESAKAVTDKRFAELSGQGLHPENRQWISAAWSSK